MFSTAPICGQSTCTFLIANHTAILFFYNYLSEALPISISAGFDRPATAAFPTVPDCAAARR
jgi:hypothetical protein